MRQTGGHLAHEHRVVLRRGSESVEVTFQLATLGLAANAAELRHPGWKAVEVWTQTKIIGRCCRCRTFLVEGQDVSRFRGKLACGECPP